MKEGRVPTLVPALRLVGEKVFAAAMKEGRVPTLVGSCWMVALTWGFGQGDERCW